VLEQLNEIGVDVSAGQLSNILVEKNEDFYQGKDGVHAIELEVLVDVNVNDTGVRHQGKNGYCTHIRNEWSFCFEPMATKSRLNFLRLPSGGSYRLSDQNRRISPLGIA